MKDVSDITTIQDAVKYWRDCITSSDSNQSKQDIASKLVGIHHSDYVEKWYEDSLFEELLSTAESLETEPDGSPHINQDWTDIQSLLNQLEDKYLK